MTRGAWAALLLLVLCGAAAAALPEAAQQDPRFKLGYVVVTAYPGVKPDGTADSTAGIQAAIQDAYADGKAVLFPAGTYLISDTLKCYEWNFWDARRGRAHNPDNRNHVLLGSTLGAERPLLRLKPDAPGFRDPGHPRPLLVYRVFTADNARATHPVEPSEPLLGNPPDFHDQPNILFESELRGIDFDCGGNRGAVGVAFRAAQESTIENVRVDATGATSGFRGIPGRNGGVANVEVDGGDYGLDLSDGGLAGTIAVGVRLTGQRQRALRNGDFCPLTVVGFRIAQDTGPVVEVPPKMYNIAVGTLCLIDGSIELKRGGPAVADAAGRTVYLRNVYVGGTSELVLGGSQPTVTGSGVWSRIAEYAYADQTTPPDAPNYKPGARWFRTWSLLDGKLSRTPEPVTTIEPNAGEPPADLASRHLWTELPSYEGQDDGTIVPTMPPYRAVPDDGHDDRPALQAAIDDASKAGHGRVFLPAGTFELGGTLTLRANTRLCGVGRTVTQLSCLESWQPTAGEPTIVETVNDPQAVTTLAFLTINARTKGGGLNAFGAHTYDRFNHLHWRAGRHSAVIGLGLAKEWVRETASNPHDNVKITGSGGGRFYFLAPSWRWFGRHPDCRALHVVGTTEPLSIYGLNLEFVAPDPASTPRTNIELTNASNVRIYSIKREMPTPTLILRDCHNVGIYGVGRQVSNPYRGSGGHLQILGDSDGIEVAPVVFDSVAQQPNGEPTLREALAGRPPVEVSYPECLSVYRRGRLDDNAMR